MPSVKSRLYYRLLYLLARSYWQIARPVTLGVRLILVREDKVLLVKHSYQRSPSWFLVGGGVKRGETIDQAARREAAEEVGAQLGKLELFGVYTNFVEGKSDHIVVFLCHDFTLAGSRDGEIERADFFPFGQLPEDLASGHRRRIKEYASQNQKEDFGSW